MFYVIYTIQDANGFLKEQKKSFAYLQEAIHFIRMINNGSVSGTKVVGKPIIERA